MLATVRSALPEVVPPEKPNAAKVWAVAVAVAAALSTSVVPLVIEAIVVPAGMPGPLTTMPAKRPVVLATVTFGLAAVVAPPVSENGAAEPVPSRVSAPPFTKVPPV